MERIALFKNGKIEVTIEHYESLIDYSTLKETNGYILKMVGEIYGECSGQINHCLMDYTDNCSVEVKERLQKLVNYWNIYHLNDLKAGTEKQEILLSSYDHKSYDDEVTILKANDLYNDRGYKYGTGWLYMPIPQEVIEDINKTVDELNCMYFGV